MSHHVKRAHFLNVLFAANLSQGIYETSYTACSPFRNLSTEIIDTKDYPPKKTEHEVEKASTNKMLAELAKRGE